MRNRVLWGSSAAIVGMVSGLLGCTGGVTMLDGRYDALPVPGGSETWERSVSSAPAPSMEVPHLLASEGEMKRATNTGWRMGPLIVTGRLADWLKGENDKSKEYITGFPWLFAWGYQFEMERGPEGQTNTLVTILPLIAGMDKSMLIPTLNVLVGLRLPNGIDFGAGPYYAPRVYDDSAYESDQVHLWGLGLTVGAGYTFGRYSSVKIPVGIAVGWAGDAVVYSVTMGWNMQE